MRILIAEDERITRRSLQRHLEGWGHDVVATEDGAEAWDQFQSRQFDIVVTDWDMPRLDGRQLIERIRARDASRYAYLIMLTGRSEKADLVAGMEAGADDFLAKPFERDELRVRLRAGERIIQLERNLAAQNQALSKANERMKHDLEAAAKFQQSLLPTEPPDRPEVCIAWHYRPCDELAGDGLNVFEIDDRHIGMYVVDVCGHGVPAALLSVTVARSLSPNADRVSLITEPSNEPPGYAIVGPAEVARRLNAAYPMDSGASRYFTMVYGILDTHTRQFRFVCAGHPGPLLARPGEPVKRFTSPALPIGVSALIKQEAVYEDAVIELRPHDRLFLHSDGVLEETNQAEEQFGEERLRSAINNGRAMTLDESIASVVHEVTAWRGDDRFSDDLTILAAHIYRT